MPYQETGRKSNTIAINAKGGINQDREMKDMQRFSREKSQNSPNPPKRNNKKP